jgi:hypothetical protein
MTRTYEATVENGQIKLLETVRVPDHTKVFVVLPETHVEPFTIGTGDDGVPIIRTNNDIITSQLVKEIETRRHDLFAGGWGKAGEMGTATSGASSLIGPAAKSVS